MTETAWSASTARDGAQQRSAQSTPLVQPDEMSDLFEQQADAIYNYCYRRTANWDVAEDLTAQVFLTAWQARDKAHQQPGSLVPWLYGIANNVCRAHQRVTKRRLTLLRQSAHEIAAPDGGDPANLSAESARLRAVLARLRQMPVPLQEVFFLICWEGLDYAACAAALNVPVGTVRSRLSRVRADLRFYDKERHHG